MIMIPFVCPMKWYRGEVRVLVVMSVLLLSVLGFVNNEEESGQQRTHPLLTPYVI